MTITLGAHCIDILASLPSLTRRATNNARTVDTPRQTHTTIRIRLYRHSDAAKIRELFKTEMATGDCSPAGAAMRAQFSSTLYLALYVIITLGLFSSAWYPSIYCGHVGAALSILAFSTICIRQYSLYSAFRRFIHYGLTGDLANIANRYGMVPDSQEGNEKERDVLVPKGTNCFWVAEAYGEDGEPELAGYIGLDVNTNTDETSAELRRLVVSPKSRRRGVAGQLIRVAMAHAKLHDMKSVYLMTSSYHTSAINLYRKLGWVIRREFILFGSIHITELNLDISASIS